MNRLSQVSVKISIPLSLLLGAMLYVANIYAQDRKQGIPDDPAVPGAGGNPDSSTAGHELLATQRQMVSMALESAREMDFESAERILEDASFVRESPDLIEGARVKIAGYRVRRAEGLRSAAMTAMESGNFSRVRQILIELIALGGADNAVNQLRRKMEEARVYGGFKPGEGIKDQFLDQEGLQDRWTPGWVVSWAGSVVMGSPATEKGR